MNAGVFLVGCCQILTFPIFPSKMKGREPDNPESRGAERTQIPWFCLVLAETRAVEDGASMQAINLGTSGLPGCLGPSSRWLSSVTGTSGTLCRKVSGWERGLERQSGLHVPGLWLLRGLPGWARGVGAALAFPVYQAGAELSSSSVLRAWWVSALHLHGEGRAWQCHTNRIQCVLRVSTSLAEWGASVISSKYTGDFWVHGNTGL